MDDDYDEPRVLLGLAAMVVIFTLGFMFGRYPNIEPIHFVYLAGSLTIYKLATYVRVEK